MTTVLQLEQNRRDVEAMQEQHDAILRLYQNRDFRKIILEGFLRDEAARYVHISVDPSIGAEERKDALLLAQSGGYLKRFLQALLQLGANAHDTLAQIDEALEEARQEEALEAAERAAGGVQ